MEQELSQLLSLPTPWMAFPSSHNAPAIVLSLQSIHAIANVEPLPGAADHIVSFLQQTPPWTKNLQAGIPSGSNMKILSLWEKLRFVPPPIQQNRNQVFFSTEELRRIFVFQDKLTLAVRYYDLGDFESEFGEQRTLVSRLFPQQRNRLRLIAYLHVPAIITAGYVRQLANAVEACRLEIQPLFHDTHRTHGAFYRIIGESPSGASEEEFASMFRQSVQMLLDVELSLRRQLRKSFQKELYLKFTALVDTIRTSQSCSLETARVTVSQLLFAAETGMLPPVATAKIHNAAQILLTPKQCPPALLPDQLRIDALRKILAK